MIARTRNMMDFILALSPVLLLHRSEVKVIATRVDLRADGQSKLAYIPVVS